MVEWEGDEYQARFDRLAATGRYVAVLCLGAIIKGETSHDHHIATAAQTSRSATEKRRRRSRHRLIAAPARLGNFNPALLGNFETAFTTSER